MGMFSKDLGHEVGIVAGISSVLSALLACFKPVRDAVSHVFKTDEIIDLRTRLRAAEAAEEAEARAVWKRLGEEVAKTGDAVIRMETEQESQRERLERMELTLGDHSRQIVDLGKDFTKHDGRVDMLRNKVEDIHSDVSEIKTSVMTMASKQSVIQGQIDIIARRG